MTLRTPHFGPLAGQICVVNDDGSLSPLPPTPPGVTASGPPVCLPDVPDIGPHAVSGDGEIAGHDTRGNRERMVRSIVEQHGPEHAAWARSKAETAVRTWDRGVRTGQIARKEH